MAVINLPNGRQFNANVGVTLLDAAASAGIVLPYSCRTGRCSSCRAFVQTGQTHPLTAEIGLSSHEIEAGWILTCVRTAVTDVALDVADLGCSQLPRARTLPCRIAQLELLAPDVLRVTLRIPPAAGFLFLPGQYIDVIGINGTRRSYSLANASSSDHLIELHVRAVDGGMMSDYWFNHAKPNDLLRFFGPLGTFFFREYTNTDIYFLVTGTGIAPVKAMLTSLIGVPDDRQPRSISVLWGGRKPEDFYIDIAAMPGKHRFIPVISRPHAGWKGVVGYVQDILLSNSPDLMNSAVYACGSDKMIYSARRALANVGLPLDCFYSDAFVSTGNN